MRSCVLTYLYLIRLLYYYMKLDYIFAWVGECIHFVLYVLPQHLCWIKIRTLTWIFQKVTFYAWILFAWMDFLFGFPAKPRLRDSVIGWNMFAFLFPNSWESPNVGQGPQLVSCNSSNTQQECAVDVRGGGYKTADDRLNEHWIRLRLLAVRIKCHSVILGSMQPNY